MKSTLGFFLLWILGACVTINIYFPEAAAEKAADRIIQDILSSSSRGGGSSGRPLEGEGGEGSKAGGGSGLLLLPVAYAQEADLDIASPAISKIRASLKARYPRLEPYFRSGALGLTQGGLVAIRDLQAIPLRERRAVRELVAEENLDRSALYREIARANGRPEWEENIRQIFARRWVANAPKGWWYQDREGRWKQK